MRSLYVFVIAAVVLVGCGPPPPDISIHKAVSEKNIQAVKQHLAAGTDVNAKGLHLKTPLHYAAIGGSRKFAELLIANGADVNAKSLHSQTPLHNAVVYGQKDFVELLIANGADVNAKDDVGDTPLDMAVGLEQPETVDLLRKHGGKTAEELEAEGK